MIPRKAIIVSSLILLLAVWSILRFVGGLVSAGSIVIPIAAIGAPGAVALLRGCSWGRTWCACYLIGMAAVYFVVIERLRTGATFTAMMTGSAPGLGSPASIAHAVAVGMVIAMLILFFILWDRKVSAFIENQNANPKDSFRA